MMRRLWEKWKRLAKVVGNFQAGVVFSVLYAVVVVPVGWLVCLRNDFLRMRSFPEWQEVEDKSGSMVKVREQ